MRAEALWPSEAAGTRQAQCVMEGAIQVRKRLTCILLALCLALTLLPTVALADTAVPSTTSFAINGTPVSVTAAYLINGTNYLQLRAIAAMLSGTAAQFDVGWDGQYAVIEPGKPYSGTVTQTRLQDTTDVRPSSTKFKMNGQVFAFGDARLIDGDTNYIQLREFAQKLSGTASQFNVYWDGAAGRAVIEPGAAYTGTDPRGGDTTPTGIGGTTRTINLDDLLVLEISNTHAYARVLGYDPTGASTFHFVVVSEGAEVKVTRYVSPDGPQWQQTEYTISPYTSIYFESGALWPTVSHATAYDDRERAVLSQGESVIVASGNEYSFSAWTSDPAIIAKYGNVDAAFYGVRVFVVPADTAAAIGGPAPAIHDPMTTLQAYHVPPGAGSAPVLYVTDPSAALLPSDGWYTLYYDHVLDVMGLAIDAGGNAVLGDPTLVYVEGRGNNQVTLRLEDGRYLGIDGTAANGGRARAVSSPYLWNIYFENNGGLFDSSRYSLRPPANTGLALTLSGTITEGTPFVLSAQGNMDAPAVAEFTFFPEED